MSPQEREELSQFLDQLIAARVGKRDSEADAMIRHACQRQPDAAYLLAQRAMIQAQALQAAQEEIARLRTPQPGAGFLDSGAWGNHALAPAQPARAASTLGGGWLGNAASMGAGVVAGSFLFQGLEPLLHRPADKHGLLDEGTPSTNHHATTSHDYPADHDDALTSLDDGLGPDDSTWL